MANHALQGYCLWLIPASTADLSAVIDRLRALAPPSPSFAPHITLLHPIPISLGVSEVATRVARAISVAKILPLSLELQQATTGERYYQSVLAPVRPTDGLLALRQAVEDEFGVRLPSYFPHLSLQYGDLAPERRHELAAAANELTWTKDVEIKDVAIVDARGVAPDWKIIARVPI
ncbi:hypothetical protein Q5752_000790 [Cryptotrichosporon argae]